MLFGIWIFTQAFKALNPTNYLLQLRTHVRTANYFKAEKCVRKFRPGARYVATAK